MGQALWHRWLWLTEAIFLLLCSSKPDPFLVSTPHLNRRLKRKREICVVFWKGDVLNISWFQTLAKSLTTELLIASCWLLMAPFVAQKYEFCKDQWCQKWIKTNDERVICSFLSMVADVKVWVQKGRRCRVLPQTSFSFAPDQVSFSWLRYLFPPLKQGSKEEHLGT